MSKLEELRRLAGGNAAESMGTPRGGPMHRPSPPAASSVPARMAGIVRSKDSAEIPVDRIIADPDQPREEFEPGALERLAESMRSKGQLQPCRVRWSEEQGAYVIVMGERRWRAATMAGLATLSCVMMEAPADSGELLVLQMIENCVREDLKPVEQARAFRLLSDRNGWSTRQIARELGMDQSSVVRSLQLLDLPAAVQDRVESGELPASSACAIAAIPDPAEQEEVATLAVAAGMNRADVAREVRERTAASKPPAKGRAKPRKTLVTLRSANGSRVTVENRKGIDDAVLEATLADLLETVRSRRASEAA